MSVNPSVITKPASDPNLLQRGMEGLANTGAAIGAAAPAGAEGAKKAVKAGADGIGDFFGKLGNGISEFTKDLGPWQAGGMVLGGLLAWVIGNAFGGGGLLGMIISACLAIFMVQAGRETFRSFDTAEARPDGGREPVKNIPALGKGIVQAPENADRPISNASLENAASPQLLADARHAAAAIHATELAGKPVPYARSGEPIQRG